MLIDTSSVFDAWICEYSSEMNFKDITGYLEQSLKKLFLTYEINKPESDLL